MHKSARSSVQSASTVFSWAPTDMVDKTYDLHGTARRGCTPRRRLPNALLPALPLVAMLALILAVNQLEERALLTIGFLVLVQEGQVVLVELRKPLLPGD